MRALDLLELELQKVVRWMLCGCQVPSPAAGHLSNFVFLLFLFCFVFKTGFLCASPVVLEPYLPQSPKCWDHRHLSLSGFVLVFEMESSYIVQDGIELEIP